MAKPIEPTPVLRGADADRLLTKAVVRPVKSVKKAALLKSCDKTYRLLAQK